MVYHGSIYSLRVSSDEHKASLDEYVGKLVHVASYFIQTV